MVERTINICIEENNIQICGLADPLFRSVEAITKDFGGFYIHSIDNEKEQYLKRKYFPIRKRNRLGFPIYAYHLVSWEFVAGYFNQMDYDDIREVYSIGLFIKSMT